MRSILFIISVITIFAAGCGNSSKPNRFDNGLQNQDTGKAVLVFSEYEHSFGKVTEGEKIGYLFKFENKGTADLIIHAAITTCGCTIPKYDRHPIHPGEKGRIEVVFDTSGRNGIQTKTVTVRSNASVPVVVLKISAEVEVEADSR
jgi:hypothetical protein